MTKTPPIVKRLVEPNVLFWRKPMRWSRIPRNSLRRTAFKDRTATQMIVGVFRDCNSSRTCEKELEGTALSDNEYGKTQDRSHCVHGRPAR